MAELLGKVTHSFNYVFGELCDDRTRDTWPNIGTLATILISYLYFCTKAGPAWMKNRKPFDLTRIIFYYNVFQIIISFYLFYEGFKYFWNEHNWICQPVNYEDTPSTRNFHNLVWIYLVLKLIELLDTVFFVLRKKEKQISNLHLYHHFMMPICASVGFKYYPNGHGMSLGVINSLVHTFMYAYYLLAGMGPKYQKHLWWKRYVTMLQLVQFVIIFFHNLLPLLTGCNYPRWANGVLCLCSLHFIYMFGNFYYKTYIKAPNKTSSNVQKVD